MSARHIAILGNGITGTTVARHLRRRGDDRITLISGESDHPYSRPALMYVFMGDMRYGDTKLYEDGFWERNRIALKRAWVKRIDTGTRRLEFEDGGVLDYDALVVATGSRSNRFGWPGQDLGGVHGLYGLPDIGAIDATAARAKRAVIVGGGLIGIELAEMLLSRGIAVTFLVRERSFWDIVLPEQEARLINGHILAHGVDLRLETEMAEIFPDGDGRARGVVTKSGEEIPCELVGLTVGVGPNIAVAKGSGIECARGVLVDSRFRTSAPGVFAGGDCAQHREPPPGRRPVEQVWYTGKIHGEHIAANLCGEDRPYEPGVWFNSAKFFDIEYQTYGAVPPRAPGGIESFYWEDPSGPRSLRVNFRADGGEVLGVNAMGIRQRHAAWEGWIASGTKIQEVMADLAAANFDPEFFRQHEPAILAAFNARHPGRAARTRARKGLFGQTITRLLGRAAA